MAGGEDHPGRPWEDRLRACQCGRSRHTVPALQSAERRRSSAAAGGFQDGLRQERLAPLIKRKIETRAPGGKYLGERVDSPPMNEAEHFMRCKACGDWIDMRDSDKSYNLKVLFPIQRRINRNDAGPPLIEFAIDRLAPIRAAISHAPHAFKLRPPLTRAAFLSLIRTRMIKLFRT